MGMEDMLTSCKQDHLVLVEVNSANYTFGRVSLIVGLRRPHEVVSSEFWVQSVAILPEDLPFWPSVVIEAQISLSIESSSLSYNNASLSYG